MAKKLNQEKKKILVVCQHYWPETFRLNDICDFFVEKGCEVDVLCGIPNYPKGRFFEGYGYLKNRRQTRNKIRIERVFEIPRGNNSNLMIFLNYISFPFASLFHIPRLLTHNYDKIFIYQLSPVLMALSGILVGKIKKIETIMYVLDLWPENLYSVLDIKSRLLRKITEKISHWHYKKVDKIVVLSNKMKTLLKEITKIPQEKITAVPQHGEKIYEKSEHDNKLEQRFSKGFNIVFAGNISPAQSFETILDAAKMLKKDKINDINWIIVGDGMSREWLETEVKKNCLSDNFFFEGIKPITEVPKYQTLADALIACLSKSPLLDCTIPAKVTSYFASGKPVILAMDGEIQEIVNNNKCGYAGPAENSAALYENIKRMYNTSKQERDQMGKNAKEFYLNNFERNINLNKLFNFIFNESEKEKC